MLQQLTTQIKLPSSDECNQKFFEGCSNWLTLFLTVSKLYLGAILPPAAGKNSRLMTNRLEIDLWAEYFPDAISN